MRLFSTRDLGDVKGQVFELEISRNEAVWDRFLAGFLSQSEAKQVQSLFRTRTYSWSTLELEMDQKVPRKSLKNNEIPCHWCEQKVPFWSFGYNWFPYLAGGRFAAYFDGRKHKPGYKFRVFSCFSQKFQNARFLLIMCAITVMFYRGREVPFPSPVWDLMVVYFGWSTPGEIEVGGSKSGFAGGLRHELWEDEIWGTRQYCIWRAPLPLNTRRRRVFLFVL